MEDLTGKHIDRYELTGLIASGGMAYIYRAYDPRLNRVVAIKFVRAEAFTADELPTQMKRFGNEAKIIANLSHPNIVKIFDYGEYEGVPYLVMELVQGETLRSLMTKPLSYTEAAEILIPIADALAYIHEQGLLHRDIKPSNIMVRTDGVPILMDFGISKPINNSESNSNLTKMGFTIGTPDYMSPEQIVGNNLDGRTDEYALAAVYYKMITGKKLYEGETDTEVRMKHLYDPIPSAKELNGDIPAEVDQMLQKALSKKPEERYPNMKDFATELRKLSGQPVRTNPIFSMDRESQARPDDNHEDKKAADLIATVTTNTPVRTNPIFSMDRESQANPDENHEDKKAADINTTVTTNTPVRKEKSRLLSIVGVLILIVLIGFIIIHFQLNSKEKSIPVETIPAVSVPAEQTAAENSIILEITNSPTTTNTATPTAADTATPTATDTAIPTLTNTAGPVIYFENGQPQVGDEISFGHFEQDNNFADGAEPLIWRVLDEKDGKLLLLSKYGLDYKKYHETAADLTWENCALRTWLNDEFLNSAFDEDELKQIQAVDNINTRNPVYYTEGGNNTLDHIFLLSIDEVNLYLYALVDRLCEPSEYLDSTKIAKSNDGYVIWWLRSPGETSGKAAIIGYGGIMGQDGNDVYINHAVRPALWVNLYAIP